MWDAATGQEVTVLKDANAKAMRSAIFSPDGRLIATIAVNAPARLWEVATGKEIAAIGGRFGIWGAAFSLDGSRLVTTTRSHVLITDTATGKQAQSLPGQSGLVWSVAFSPNGTRFVTASSDTTARVWDTPTGAEIAVLKGYTKTIWRAAFGPDGHRVVTASDDGTARIWDSDSGREVAVLKGHAKSVRQAEFSADGQRILTRSSDETARIWEGGALAPEVRGRMKARELAVLDGHSESIASVVYSPDGRRILTASNDKTARIWDSETGKAIATLAGHATSLSDAEFSPDGRLIVTVSGDATARIWDAASGRLISLLEQACGARSDFCNVFAAAFSPDGRQLVTGSSNSSVKVWAPEAAPENGPWRAVKELKGPGHWIYGVAFSPDGRYIAGASHDTKVWLWNRTSGEVAATLKQDSAVRSLAISRDGRRLIAAADNLVAIWEQEPGKAAGGPPNWRKASVLQGHKGVIWSARFSADDRFIVTAAGDQTVRIWDATTGS